MITNLDVHYDVRTDGTVGVTYRLDYRFGETGRRGITFAIIRKEPYGDGIQDVRYGVSNLDVESPSGAPDTFEESTDTIDGTGLLTLRIGDADKPLTTRNASYLIRFDLAGALETHGDYAELYRDVTTDYPTVEKYSVTVTAPGGVRDTECATRSSTCAEALDGDSARYSGTTLAKGDQLTVAAKLDAGRIGNARPHLEPQPITSPRILAVDSTTTVRPDAVVEVRQVTTYRFPARNREVTYAIPVRRPFSDTQDQLFQVSNVAVTGATGAPLGVRQRLRESGSDHTREVTVQPDPATLSPEGVGTLALSYDVAGAFRGEPGHAQLRWPLVAEPIAPFTEITAGYRMPGPLTAISCERLDDPTPECGLPLPERTDQSATFRVPRAQRVAPDPEQEQIVVTVPADSVGHPVPTLGESLDRRDFARAGKSLAVTFGLVVATITGAIVMSRRQAFPDSRYTGVPPGVFNRGGPVGDDDRIQPPVRFEPPETDLATAGRLLDGRYLDRHATAEIVGAAVRGLITIQTHPPFTLRPSEAGRTSCHSSASARLLSPASSGGSRLAAFPCPPMAQPSRTRSSASVPI